MGKWILRIAERDRGKKRKKRESHRERKRERNIGKKYLVGERERERLKDTEREKIKEG